MAAAVALLPALAQAQGTEVALAGMAYSGDAASLSQRFPFSTAQLNEGCYYYVVTVGPEKMGAGRFNVAR